MTADTLRAQLEAEYAWRIDEVRFFQNQCATVGDGEPQDKFRRALILLLYANFEGFCQFALKCYVSELNALNIDCCDATVPVAAASMSDIFQYLRDGTGSSEEFKASGLPDDNAIKSYFRNRQFLAKSVELMKRKVRIPDQAIDMEFNLKPEVLRKNLFRVGLPHDQLDEVEPDIKMLLSVRNQIAHGESKKGITKDVYEKYRAAATKVMTELMVFITRAITERHYLASAYI